MKVPTHPVGRILGLLGAGIAVILLSGVAPGAEATAGGPASIVDTPTNVLLFGKPEGPAPPIRLRAGPLRMTFEPDTLFLRYIRFGDREILRAVYAAVRDAHWGTIPPRISRLKVDRSADSFDLSFQARCQKGDIDFRWRGRLTGREDATVGFSMDGQARTTFLRNRIGFCVLHPIAECAGRPCLVEKTDGTRQQGVFPVHISPHQPFRDIKAISHEVVGGLRSRVEFAGDVFEMEDQRNWTDASYKTYCTPLALPFPVRIEAGDRVRQSVQLSLIGQVPRRPPRRQPRPCLLSAEPNAKVPLPTIGLGMAGHGRRLSAKARRRLAETVRPDHLRVELRLSQPGWRNRLAQARRRAQQLQTRLELVLFLSDQYQRELKALTEALAEANRSAGRRGGRYEPAALARCLVLAERQAVTSDAVFASARRALKRYSAETPVGTGTDRFFAELNRNRPPLEQADLVAYSINPQVHAFDNRSIVESFVGQEHTVISARQFCGTVPIVVTPVTWKIRSATRASEEPGLSELPPSVDTRQMSLFGAGFTLGTLKHLAQAKACSVTFYETTGWHGIMETEGGSPLPGQFPAPPDCVYPVYHFLADVRDFDRGHVVPSRSSRPLEFEGVILEKQGRRRICLANLSGNELTITCEKVSGPVRVRVIDESSVRRAMTQPEQFRRAPRTNVSAEEGSVTLRLKPFAYATIDAPALRD